MPGPEESIFENLTFGIQDSPSLDWMAIEKRALAIMRRLGLSEAYLDDDFKRRGFLVRKKAGGSKADKAERAGRTRAQGVAPRA